MWTSINYLFRTGSRKSRVTASCQRRIRLLAELLEDRLAPAGAVAGSAVTQQVALPFDDLFTAANGTALSGAWVTESGAFSIQDNQLVAAAKGTNVATLAGLSLSDVALQASMNFTAAGSAGLLARESAAVGGQMYWGGVVNSGGSRAEIWREVSGAWKLLASTPITNPVGTYRFEVFGSSLKLFLDDLQVAAASDSAITAAGALGVWAPKNAILDNFEATSAAVAGMALPISDVFDRADSTRLGSPWTEVEGDFAVQGGRLAAVSSAASTAVVAAAPIADVLVEADVNVPATGSAGLVARQSGFANDDFYWGGLVSRGGAVRAEIWLKLDGNWRMLSSQQVASASARLRLEAVASSLKLFVNDQLATFATNKALASAGLVGVWSGAQGVIDNFHAEQIVTFNTDLPFNDSFDQADGAQLSRFWNQLEGNFTVRDNRLVSAASGASSAALAGVSFRDESVQADVTLVNAGSAAVTARQAASGDMYWGGIASHNGGVSAEIWARHHGDWTLLASAPASAATGTIRLDVLDTTLTLFFNGASLLQVTDTRLTAPGSVGVWASNQSTIDNFTASDPPAPGATVANPLLTLTLKPLNLNLLGLRVQSSPITVTLTPAQGDGKLLGNLLTAVSSLVGMQKINAALNNVLGATVDLLNSVGLQVAGVGSGDFSSAQPAVTSLVDVVVAPVHLDLLGVQVDTSPIHLAITAQSGNGLVLGNVLAQLANLFNPPLPKQLSLGTINDRLVQLLNRLNQQIPGIPAATVPPPSLGNGQILSLTVPAIDLNLLGLRLKTTPITVNAAAQQGNGLLLGNVLQTLLNTLGATPGQLSNLSNNVNQLLAKVIGVLNAATLTFPTNAVASLSQALQTLALPNLIAPANGASAAILNLVIASPNGTTPPVNVNLLGLVVTTSNINAQLSAQTGPGQVLGNLLYNLANLLNPGGPASLISLLTALASGSTTSGASGSNSATGSVAGAPVQVLMLTLPPLNLNLLGLAVQSDPITVTISAQKGDGKLLGNVLTGVSTLINTQGVSKALNNVLATTVGLLNSVGLKVSGVLDGSFSTGTAATTPVLDLSVAPVHLDLLGALVDTNPIHLKITAQGNNLRHALCRLRTGSGAARRRYPSWGE